MENGGSHTAPITTGSRMANRKPAGKPPQAQHANKTESSQNDKRRRLIRLNVQRRHTTAASVPLRGNLRNIAQSMGRMLDARIAF